MHTPFSRTAPALLLAASLAACSGATAGQGPRAVQPGAPGDSSRVIAPGGAAADSRLGYTEADVRFMQGMITHHRQALELAALAPSRSRRDDILLLARRIEVSQSDEIAMMRRWLEERGQPLEPAGAGHPHHGAGGAHPSMPGMATPEEMARLAAARGPEFDRLLLELMIRHHLGALAMVEELFSSSGAGQQGDVYQMAAEIAGDQRIEIDRMQAMLASGR